MSYHEIAVCLNCENPLLRFLATYAQSVKQILQCTNERFVFGGVVRKSTLKLKAFGYLSS